MRPKPLLRWTKEQACAEFGINPRTLATRMRRSGIEHGEDGRYSTKQVCEAVFGDIDTEKLRLVKEQADKLELENARMRGEMVPIKEAVEQWSKFVSSVRYQVDSHPLLSRDDKDKIIEKFGQILEVVFGNPSGDAATDDPTPTVQGQSMVGDIPLPEP